MRWAWAVLVYATKMSWFFWPSSSATSSATKPEVAHSSIPSSPDPTEFVSIEGQSPRRLSDAVLPSVSFRMTPNTPDRPQSMSRSDSMVDRIDKIDKPSSPARVELAGLESSADNVNQVNPSTSDSGLVDRIRDAGIHVLVTLMVWSSGWFGFSFAWTLLALLLYHVRRMHRDSSRQRQSASRQLALDEKLVIERNIGQLPNWVYFPDAERVEWLNRVIRQLWPFIELYVQKMLRDSLLPTLVSYLPDYMKGLRFETIDLGNIVSNAI